MWHSVCGDCKNSPKKGKQLQSNCNSQRAIKLWAASPTYMSRMNTNMLVVHHWATQSTETFGFLPRRVWYNQK